MFEVVTEGLSFPEGPIAMPDGSVILVEICAANLTRVNADGNTDVIASLGGGPNGAAIGPDGHCYVCNNGGGFAWQSDENGTRVVGLSDDYSGGRIERVNLETGELETLYTHCGDIAIQAPNDIVFDEQGGFWFTDTGRRLPTSVEHGAVYYATVDGKHIERRAYPMMAPNGIGLSPDEKTLYVTETQAGRLWRFKVDQPGTIAKEPTMTGGTFMTGVSTFRFFDSFAMDVEGGIHIGSLQEGGITSVSADAKEVTHTPLPDRLVTNMCFGGEGLKTAYITLGLTGKLIKMTWPTAGLPLNFLNK